MRTRILEKADLHVLATIPGPFFGHPDVLAQLGDGQVIAVEDDSNSIVAYWPIWVAVHLEPLWVSPEARKNPAVIKALITTMQEQLKLHRITTAFAVIGHADLVQNLPLAARIGFERVPGDLFFVKAEEEEATTHGSSSGPSDLTGRPVLHEPGREQEDRRGDGQLADGPPGLGG